jgi:hypothetical protein
LHKRHIGRCGRCHGGQGDVELFEVVVNAHAVLSVRGACVVASCCNDGKILEGLTGG